MLVGKRLEIARKINKTKINCEKHFSGVGCAEINALVNLCSENNESRVNGIKQWNKWKERKGLLMKHFKWAGSVNGSLGSNFLTGVGGKYSKMTFCRMKILCRWSRVKILIYLIKCRRKPWRQSSLEHSRCLCRCLSFSVWLHSRTTTKLM